MTPEYSEEGLIRTPGLDGGRPKLGGGWSSSNTLATLSTRTGGLQQVFPVAGPYTLQFNLASRNQAASVIECEAEIEWAVAGNSVRRCLTVFNGASITGIAEGVQVRVKDVTSTGLADVEYDVFITCAYGQRIATVTPPILVPRVITNPVIVVPGGTFDFPVPNDCGVSSVNVMVSSIQAAADADPIPDQGAQVFHMSPGIFPIRKSYDPRACCWVPIAPGTNAIRVANTQVAGENKRFTLTWGIDG